jgi:hypothetical protein
LAGAASLLGCPLFKVLTARDVFLGAPRKSQATSKKSGHWSQADAPMARVLDKRDFRAKLDKLHPRYGKPTQLSLEFADEDEPDTGKGL